MAQCTLTQQSTRELQWRVYSSRGQSQEKQDEDGTFTYLALEPGFHREGLGFEPILSLLYCLQFMYIAY